MGAIFYREMKAYFSSLLAWSLIAAFLAVLGIFTARGIYIYAELSANAMQGGTPMNVNSVFLPGIFGTIASLFMFFIPLVTMRAFADDKRSGMLDLLFTYPLSDWEIVLGKFLGIMPVTAIMMLCSCTGILLVSAYCTIEWGVVFSGYLGTVLFACSVIAMGIFSSCVTNNQLMAAALHYLLIFCHLGLYGTDMSQSLYVSSIGSLSIMSHIDNFAKGVISSQDIIYYLGTVAFFIYLSVRFLESRKWRT